MTLPIFTGEDTGPDRTVTGSERLRSYQGEGGMQTQVSPLSEPKPFPPHEYFLLSYHNQDRQNAVTNSDAPCSGASFWINTICSERARISENVTEIKAFYPTLFITVKARAIFVGFAFHSLL